MKKSELSLPEIFRILRRRKWIIASSILLFIILALLYNIFRKPVYEASALLKKEVLFENQNPQDKIQNLLGLLSQDEVETEMQLIQSRSVINSVIEELSLNINITEIIEQDGTVTTINLPIAEYQNKIQKGELSNKLPQINKIFVGLKNIEDKFVISQLNKNRFNLKNLDKSINRNFNSKEELTDDNNFILDFNWPDSIDSGEIHFEVQKYDEVYKIISNQLFVEKKIKTNIFEVSANSNYPYLTKRIVNTFVEKFKSIRFKQNKENIRYSFNFIDERLQEVSKSLAEAEDSLSKFKSRENIAQMDEHSKKIIDFLSELESEKLKNDLELGIYSNKLAGIKKEMDKKGYVDQTYLTPEQYQSFNSPFSSSLSELAKLELARLELLQKRTEYHPDVQILSEKIEKIRDDLRKYNKNTLTAIGIISNSLKQKQRDINRLIAKYKSQLKKLPAQEAKLAELIRKKEGFEKIYNVLLDKREEMRVAELSRLQDIIVIDSAVEPNKPVLPNKKLNFLAALFVGLLFGIITAFITDMNAKKINDIYDIEKNFNYPILSVVPPYTKNIINNIEKSPKTTDNFVTLMDENFKYKEAYRRFETKIVSKALGKPQIVMITSCEENEGKTSAAANLAITAAKSNKKVLLIDCDIKKPGIAQQFGLPPFTSGLIDYLTEETNTPTFYKPVKLKSDPTLLINLDIIPTGDFSNISGEILASERMQTMLSNLDYYDLVVIDTPPISRLSDAISLARIVKNTVLVIRAGQTIKESINWAVSELKTTDINFLGVLVNDCEIDKKNYKYQYGYAAL